MKKEGRAEIFGIGIEVGGREELIESCAEMIGRGGVIATVNPEIMRRAASDRRLYRALKSAVNIPDGVGIKLALALTGVSTDRLPGIELGEALLDIHPCRLAIIGGREGVAREALAALAERHKLVTPTFARDGYSLTIDEARSLIALYAPDIVFVCLGSPRQEIFSYNMHKLYRSALFVSLGGSADVYSGAKRRAPRPVRRVGLEWAWRILKEPKRLKRLPLVFGFFVEGLKRGEFFRKNYPKTIKKERETPLFLKKLKKIDKN